ncbi:MAG: Blue-light-activated protein [Syntrophorhabdaceae bacterium PtaU1.Bin034]|nr:MAG: Blue-light-activated protein [Syntrophorhabdaceae bacterium PtaU1.Bin034]
MKRFPVRLYMNVVVGLAICAGLYATSRYSYLLFHTIAEVFSIVVAFGIFVVAWNSRRFLDNNYLLFIGIAYLFVGCLDFVHTISYRGMRIFPGDDPNPATQLWIAARYMESISLFVAPFFLKRTIRVGIIIAVYCAAAVLILLSIFSWHVFPDCFVNGTGLTPFKKTSEYIISLILIGSIGLFLRHRQNFDRTVFVYVVWSIVLTIGSELAFTFYVSVYGLSNFIGHVLKILSFYLIYKALIETGLSRPYDLLFRNLKQSEATLREQREWLRVTLTSIGDAVIATDTAGRITFLNPVAAMLTGWRPEEAVGQPVEGIFKIVNEMTKEPGQDIVRRVLSERRAVSLENHTALVSRDGREIPIEDSAAPIEDFSGRITGVVLVFHDVTEKRRAQQALRESEERLRLATESAALGTWDFDPVTGDLNWSQSCKAIYGLPPDAQLDYETFLGRVHPDDRQRVRGAVEEALRSSGDGCYNAEYRALWPDGTERWIASAGRAFFSSVIGQPLAVRLIGTVIDMTERKKAETRLQRSLQRFELLSRTAEELLQASDPQNVVESLCGKVMEHLDCHAFFNFLADHEAGRLRLNACSGIPPVEAERIEWLDYGVAVCGYVAQSGSRIVAEHIPTTPDERTELVKSYGIKAYACHPLVGPEGEVMGTLSFGTRSRETFTDEDLSLMKAVTDQVAVAMVRMKNAEALRKAHDELEERVRDRTVELRRQADLLDLAHDAIFVCDLRGTIIFWNAGAEKLYGWSRREACGAVSQDLLQTTFPEAYRVILARVIRDGRWEGELRHRKKDGNEIRVLSRWRLQRDGEGQPVALMETNTDITEQRRLEQQLRQTQKIESIGTLAGGIAHDFNNILAAIIGFSEMAKDRTPRELPTWRYMERVFNAGVRGRDLVKQILMFSRQAEQEKRPLQLGSVVKETVKLLRASLPATVDIRTNVNKESGFVLADLTQMQQVVMNLCTNAAFAMRQKGGKMVIDLSDFAFSSQEKAPYPDLAPGSYVKLTVSDTGEGMTPAVAERIFDPFFTTKPKGEGTGLGLSVVHGIVTSHGGAITVSSEPGEGSTFDIYLPKYQEDQSETSGNGDGEGAVPGGRETILFVDDEEALADLGSEILGELGYNVVTRTNSRDALALFRLDPSRFDLVVTDQTMPDLTGIDLAREVMVVKPDIPVILCTGFSHLVDADSARAAGIRGFVVKPLTKKEIALAIRKVLDR